MYQFRRELRMHFFAIVLPNVAISIGSLFAYPYICFVTGISAERSLAFAARSLTLALAIPAVANLGGDSNTVAALAITSGIVGVLIGQRMLALLKIPDGTPHLAICDCIALDSKDTSADTCVVLQMITSLEASR